MRTADSIVYTGQKAPSAKRCIKTRQRRDRALREASQPESTERQKVH